MFGNNLSTYIQTLFNTLVNAAIDHTTATTHIGLTRLERDPINVHNTEKYSIPDEIQTQSSLDGRQSTLLLEQGEYQINK